MSEGEQSPGLHCRRNRELEDLIAFRPDGKPRKPGVWFDFLCQTFSI
jgi:hypothetical protein